MVKAFFFLLPLSYSCPKVGPYYHPLRGRQRAKALKFQWKTKNIFGICRNFFRTDLLTSLEFFWFCLTISVQEKIKNLIFEMPITSQTLCINNLITTSAKLISLDTIRKLIEYSLKKFGQSWYLLLPFRR